MLRLQGADAVDGLPARDGEHGQEGRDERGHRRDAEQDHPGNRTKHED